EVPKDLGSSPSAGKLRRSWHAGSAAWEERRIPLPSRKPSLLPREDSHTNSPTKTKVPNVIRAAVDRARPIIPRSLRASSLAEASAQSHRPGDCARHSPGHANDLPADPGARSAEQR